MAELGVAEMEKSGVVGGVTTKSRGVKLTRLPSPPWTVKLYVPAATELSVLRVSVEVPPVPGMELLVKLAVAPAGKPSVLRPTVPEYPFAGLNVRV